MPEEVIEDLKPVDPLLRLSEYQPSVPAYIGQGLPSNLEPLERNATLSVLSVIIYMPVLSTMVSAMKSFKGHARKEWAVSWDNSLLMIVMIG
jgi:hypothetical protein